MEHGFRDYKKLPIPNIETRNIISISRIINNENSEKPKYRIIHKSIKGKKTNNLLINTFDDYQLTNMNVSSVQGDARCTLTGEPNMKPCFVAYKTALESKPIDFTEMSYVIFN
jgi:hypothetical protein